MINADFIDMVETLGIWLGQTGLAVTALIVFVLLVRRPVARYFGAKAAYGLWALPLLRIFLPTISLPSWFRTGRGVSTPDMLTVYPPNIHMAHTPAEFVPPQVSWMVCAFGIWAVVAVILILHGLYRHHIYRQNIIMTSSLGSFELAHKAEFMARNIGLKRKVAIRTSDGSAGPLVMGVVSPIIVLPKNFTEHFTPAQQDFALLHELLHIRRGDLWAAFAAFIFGALNWPNPFMRLAARAFRIDQEAACDASVLSHKISRGADRASYAQTLMQAATLCSSTPARMPLGLSIHHPLKERIMSLKNPTPITRLRPRLIGASALAAAFMLTAPYSIADPEEELAGKATKSHSIMKIVKDDNGTKTKKTIEITKDGDTVNAWETNELTGERRELEASELEDMDIQIMNHSGGMKVMKFHMDEGEFTHDMDVDIDIMKELMESDVEGKMNKRIMIFGDHDKMTMHHDMQNMTDDKNVFVMKMHKDGMSHSRMATDAKISAALSLLEDEIDGKDVSDDVRRSLRKAQKALEKAQRKLDAEE
ncbi:MAG: M56 family metallopeptidase [Maricaulaceae bacterium]